MKTSLKMHRTASRRKHKKQSRNTKDESTMTFQITRGKNVD